MDKYQPWLGVFADLDQVYQYISKLDRNQRNKKKNHELFITWVLAKFLTAVNKKSYLVGLPVYTKDINQNLFNILKNNSAIDDEKFETIIIEKGRETVPLRIQIKRFKSEGIPDTDSFFNYMINKISRYGEDTKLNIIIDIQTGFRIHRKRLFGLIKAADFKIGSVFVFFVVKNDKNYIPYIKQIFPYFSNEYYPEEAKR